MAEEVAVPEVSLIANFIQTGMDRIDIRGQSVREHNRLWHDRYFEHAIDPNGPTYKDIPGVKCFASSNGESLYMTPNGVLITASSENRGGKGHIRVLASADTPEKASEVIRHLKTAFPRWTPPPIKVPDRYVANFWRYHRLKGPHGSRRVLDAHSWEEVENNYPAGVSDELAHVFGPDFRPGQGGQLHVWHGPPGTGKTTALRTLAREWRSWCDMHYIVDPDRFFSPDGADYMMEVLMTRTEDPTRWRLIILEDCGELLAKDAKASMGQQLSRLLNVCDGWLGRGLRLMIVITTNEPMDTLADAVTRPGRCASNIAFKKFDYDQAQDWIVAHGGDPKSINSWDPDRSLADLYATVGEVSEVPDLDVLQEEPEYDEPEYEEPVLATSRNMLG